MKDQKLQLEMEGADMKLEVIDMSFCYERRDRQRSKKQIYQKFNVTLHSKERLGLTAPSGFGKTTLCKVMAGYVKPLSGQVLLDQRPLESYTGYCPVQMIWQHPDLAVNPRFQMKDILAEAGPIEERILTELGIQEEWMTRFPAELSGGELQRFCIARALGKDTRFLLADEITAMLDLVSRKQIWEFLLRETKRRDIGLLIVSHHQELLDELCTRQIDLCDDKGCFVVW